MHFMNFNTCICSGNHNHNRMGQFPPPPLNTEYPLCLRFSATPSAETESVNALQGACEDRIPPPPLCRGFREIKETQPGRKREQTHRGSLSLEEKSLFPILAARPFSTDHSKMKKGSRPEWFTVRTEIAWGKRITDLSGDRREVEGKSYHRLSNLA